MGKQNSLNDASRSSKSKSRSSQNSASSLTPATGADGSKGVYFKQRSIPNTPDGGIPMQFEKRQMDAPDSTLKYADREPEGPYIMTGPVIGLVTDTTARIVFETNVTVHTSCFLTDPSGQQLVVKKTMSTREPSAVEFTGLTPETYYKVSFNIPTPGLIKSGFKTIPTNWSLQKSEANFCFVSCNKYRITRDDIDESVDLWKDVYKKAAHGEIDYIIHMGDNVYADSDLFSIEEGTMESIKDCRWAMALQLMKGVEQSQWHSYFDEICEICRTVYRETWNHPPTKHALANVPNLMIMDDHDIRDDWGDRPTDADPTTLEFFLACCFYNVYNEYQRNLFEDYVSVRNAYDSTKVGASHHFHVFGDIALMLTDSRGCKTFHKNYNDPLEKELPLLGVNQWNDIENALKEDGLFSDCRLLYAVCPQPPCYIGEGPNMFVAKLSRFFDDLYGSWSASYNVPEASLFLQALFDWRAQKPGLREACIVAGDVHEGGFTDITDLRYHRQKDRRIDRMKQITTSAIANEITKPHEHQALNLARTMVNSIGKWHQFSHYSWTGMRNFNVIRAFAEKDEKQAKKYNYTGYVTKFSSSMFGAHHKHKKSLSPVESSYRTYSMPSGWATCFGGALCGLGFVDIDNDERVKNVGAYETFNKPLPEVA